MKKNIKHIIYLLLVINGAIVMTYNQDFSFYWWIGFVNISFFGGALLIKLFNYLDN